MRLARLRLPALTGPLMWNGAASVIGQGVTLLVTVLLSNRLGPTDYARYAIAVGTTLTLSAVAQSGLAFTATNFVARFLKPDPAAAAAVARFCIRAALLLGLVFGAGLAMLAVPIARDMYEDESLTPIFLIASAAIPFAALTAVQGGVAIGLQRFRIQTVSATVFAASLLACTAAGVALGGAMGAAAGYALAIALRAGYMQISLAALKGQAAGSRTSSGIAREILPFALPAGIAGLTLTPAVWGTNALLAGRYGLHDLGIFSAAFTLKTLIAFVPMQLGTVFLPRYVAMRVEDSARAGRQLILAVLAVAGFSAALAVPFAVFGGVAMTAFGADFAQGANILRWLMLSVIFECAATLWSYRLAAERRMWTSVLGFTIPKDMILVAAAFVLVPVYGAEGLAIAHLASWIYALLALAIMAVLHLRTDSDGQAA